LRHGACIVVDIYAGENEVAVLGFDGEAMVANVGKVAARQEMYIEPGSRKPCAVESSYSAGAMIAKEVFTGKSQGEAGGRYSCGASGWRRNLMEMSSGFL